MNKLAIVGSSEFLGTTAGIIAGWYAESAVEKYVPAIFGGRATGAHKKERLFLRVGLVVAGLALAVAARREPWLRDIGFGAAAIEAVHALQGEGYGKGF